MPSSKAGFVLAAYLLSLSTTALANTCSWLDPTTNETIAASGYSACAASGASTCCGDTDACLSNGYCTGSYGLYRGACTDWTAGVCPYDCPNISYVFDGATYFPANLYRCNYPENVWWCGVLSGSSGQPCQSDYGTLLTMTSVGTLMAPLAAAATAGSAQTSSSAAATTTSASSTTSTSSSSASAAAASTSAAAPSSSSKSSSALGIGLGVGLGIPLLAALAAVMYLLARRKRTAAPAAAVSEKQLTPDHQREKGAWVAEPPPEELHGKQFHEIHSTQQHPPMAELGARDQ